MQKFLGQRNSGPWQQLSLLPQQVAPVRPKLLVRQRQLPKRPDQTSRPREFLQRLRNSQTQVEPNILVPFAVFATRSIRAESPRRRFLDSRSSLAGVFRLPEHHNRHTAAATCRNHTELAGCLGPSRTSLSVLLYPLALTLDLLVRHLWSAALNGPRDVGYLCGCQFNGCRDVSGHCQRPEIDRQEIPPRTGRRITDPLLDAHVCL